MGEVINGFRVYGESMEEPEAALTKAEVIRALKKVLDPEIDLPVIEVLRLDDMMMYLMEAVPEDPFRNKQRPDPEAEIIDRNLSGMATIHYLPRTRNQ